MEKSSNCFHFIFVLNQKAEAALKYYKGYQGNDEAEYHAFCKEFEKLKTITNVQNDSTLHMADFCMY